MGEVDRKFLKVSSLSHTPRLLEMRSLLFVSLRMNWSRSMSMNEEKDPPPPSAEAAGFVAIGAAVCALATGGDMVRSFEVVSLRANS